MVFSAIKIRWDRPGAYGPRDVVSPIAVLCAESADVADDDQAGGWRIWKFATRLRREVRNRRHTR
jgi:hypothetical protein